MLQTRSYARAGSQALVQPFTRSALPARRSLVAHASPESNGVIAAAPAFTGPLNWTKDTETIRDVFVFAGPLPERTNGRIAMWAFANFAFVELSSHTPVLEQASNGVFSAVFFSLLIAIASLAPKLLSGMSLKELHDSATSQNLSGPGVQQVLGLFDQNVELWTGRVAMLGVTGLVVAEIVKGDAFF